MASTLQQAQTTGVQPECLHPFEAIGLAFSGGGFRAASFALGVLSYLHELPFRDHTKENEERTLLQKVTYMSSASGGTITTALYALYQGQEKTFEAFYKKLYTELYGDTLLKKALNNLITADCWKNRPHKHQNIINAFALAYDECLFDKCFVDDLFPKTITDQCHLEEVCFNATEFFRGLLFRQQVAIQPHEGYPLYFGSFVIHLEEQTARTLKLSDVLAASSCFPAGFEPIIFPDDFANDRNNLETLKESLKMEPQTNDKKEREFINKKTFGLMDGGITDNQGLESLMQADQRRLKGEHPFKPFSLMLVNDVASHFIDPYVEPSFKKSPFWDVFSLKIVKIILALTIVLCSAGSWYSIQYLPSIASIAWLIGLIFIGSFSLFFLLFLFNIQDKLKGSVSPNSSFNLAKNFSAGIVKTLLQFLNKTSLRILLHLGKERIRSVLMLNSDVFLKRIRYLLYESFYNSPQWQNRGKGNHVYDLSFTNDLNRKQHSSDPPLPPEYSPSKPMQTVAQVAFTMGTTLWFDVKTKNQCNQEACLIACGQFTTCYNLLEYIWRLEHNTEIYPYISLEYKNRLLQIKNQLLRNYENFKTDPFYLYNELGNRYKLPSFESLFWESIQCDEIKK